MARMNLDRSGGFIGMGGLAATLFLTIGSAHIAPWWVSVLLVVLWLWFFARGARRFESAPRQVFWLPVWNLAIWLVVVLYGVHSLGWGGASPGPVPLG